MVARESPIDVRESAYHNDVIFPSRSIGSSQINQGKFVTTRCNSTTEVISVYLPTIKASPCHVVNSSRDKVDAAMTSCLLFCF